MNTWQILRARMGLEKAEMARLLQIDRSLYSRIEDEKRLMSPQQLADWLELENAWEQAQNSEPDSNWLLKDTTWMEKWRSRKKDLEQRILNLEFERNRLNEECHRLLAILQTLKIRQANYLEESEAWKHWQYMIDHYQIRYSENGPRQLAFLNLQLEITELERQFCQMQLIS